MKYQVFYIPTSLQHYRDILFLTKHFFPNKIKTGHCSLFVIPSSLFIIVIPNQLQNLRTNQNIANIFFHIGLSD